MTFFILSGSFSEHPKISRAIKRNNVKHKVFILVYDFMEALKLEHN